MGSLSPAQESSSPPSRGSLTHNQTDCFRCQLCELNWEPYQSLQEVNASNNADSEVQPLAAQAKVPRPAKHDDAGARATMLLEALETVQNGTCSKTPKRVRKAVQPLQLLFSQSEREREKHARRTRSEGIYFPYDAKGRHGACIDLVNYSEDHLTADAQGPVAPRNQDSA